VQENSTKTVLKQIDSILGQNNARIEQIKFTLMSSMELLNEFEYLKSEHKRVSSEVSNATVSTIYIKAEVIAQGERITKELDNVYTKATTLKTTLETLANQAIESADNAQKALIDTQVAKDSVDSSVIEVQVIKDKVETTYNLITQLQTTIDEIKAIQQNASLLKNELDSFVLTKKPR